MNRPERWWIGFWLTVSWVMGLPSEIWGAEWQTGAGFRSRELIVAPGKTGFTPMSPEATAVWFTNVIAMSRHLTNQIYLNGSGVAAGDVDGDGRCDLYFAGLDGPNALYRNLGNWRFTNITEQAGIVCSGLDATGVALIDLDGDRDLDLLVNSVGGGTECWLNDGAAHFRRLSVFNGNKGGMSLALADVDGDGDLDVYVTNYRTSTLKDQPNTRFRIQPDNGKFTILRVNDRPVTEPDLVGRFTLDARGKIIEQGEADVLLLNAGGGQFEAQSFLGGAFVSEDGKPLTALPYDWGLSAMFRDLNGDHLPDLYVCNDFSSPDRIWLNSGQGRFQALDRLAIRSTSLFSMGVDVGDLNRDGYDDIFVVDMLSRDQVKRHNQMGDVMPARLLPGEIDNRPQYARNTLFLNRGDGTYAEIARFSGLDASEWSWTTILMDVDLDGWEDVLVANGHERDALNADITRRLDADQSPKSVLERLQMRKEFPRLALARLAFHNRRNLTFEEKGRDWNFAEVGVGNGMALADLDNDGDLDVAINNLNGRASLLRTDTPAPRVAVRLSGQGQNTAGIGARIVVEGGPVTQSQEMIAGGRYLSSDESLRVFAAGAISNQVRIRVEWRAGGTSLVSEVRANRLYEISEPAPPPVGTGALTIPLTAAPANRPWFQDVSTHLGHVHHEEVFDDFQREPLLPRKLSQGGPGLAWFDADGDQRDDLIISSGRGGQLAIYRSAEGGRWTLLNEAPVSQRVTRDQTAPLGYVAGAKRNLIVGSSNYEDGLAIGAVARIYDLTANAVLDYLPGQPASTGPMLLADFNGDGFLDLFVGGRAVPGRYPEPASSLVLFQREGRWELSQAYTMSLTNVGLVSGAVATDLDGDGMLELVLACEAGPIRVFKNNGKGLTESTAAWGLQGLVGWWNSIQTGDFDEDGRMDLVVGNWGLNSAYHSLFGDDLRYYYGDFNTNGQNVLLEAYFNRDLNAVVPVRELPAAVAAMPFLRASFPGHESYARASVAVILTNRSARLRETRIQTWATTLFLNRGQKFEALKLPDEVQWSPVFGVTVADFDGDSHEDLFLSQNFFGTPLAGSRLDAGRGLLLRGSGVGTFTTVSGAQSGVLVYGEGRGSATADYDQDGRADLAVAQNGADTKLYHNEKARPGLGVRLKGGPGNPDGIGARIRLNFEGRSGPMREVHAGAGYWSQDSARQVLGVGEEKVKSLTVQFPGGVSQTAVLPPGARSIVVDARGAITVTNP